MALINIDYGSLASSDTMNKNFLYLENRISESVEDLNTSISSLLSNIATINTNVSNLSETLSNKVTQINSTIDDLKTRTEIIVNNSTMVPNWKKCTYLSSINNYVAPSNGYLLMIPFSDAVGDITVNNIVFSFKLKAHVDDHSAQLVSMPVKKGDVITCTTSLISAHFMPTTIFDLDSIEV